MHFDSRGGLRIDTFLTRGPFFFFYFCSQATRSHAAVQPGYIPVFLRKLSMHRWTWMAARGSRKKTTRGYFCREVRPTRDRGENSEIRSRSMYSPDTCYASSCVITETQVSNVGNIFRYLRTIFSYFNLTSTSREYLAEIQPRQNK